MTEPDRWGIASLPAAKRQILSPKTDLIECLIQLLDWKNEEIEQLKEQLHDRNAKPGKVNSSKYQRIRDLALDVYLDAVDHAVKADPSLKSGIQNGIPRVDLLRRLRPSFKSFAVDFEERFRNSPSWTKFEENWFGRYLQSIPTESGLYHYWRGFNGDLKLVLSL
jgi:hypothetical protein